MKMGRVIALAMVTVFSAACAAGGGSAGEGVASDTMDKQHNSTRGHPVAVTEDSPFVDAAPDYADAFEIGKKPSDTRSAEQWARDGFGSFPSAIHGSGMFLHRHLLGFRLGPSPSPDHIFGWSIVTSRPDVLHLEAKGDLMDGHMVWRVEEDRVRMTTFVKYDRPRMGAFIWAIAGPIHRRGVPGLLQRAADKPGS